MLKRSRLPADCRSTKRCVSSRELRLAKKPAMSRILPGAALAPASLLANWAAEVERFAPGLSVLVAHPSATSVADLKAFNTERLADIDLVITSYGALLRYPWLSDTAWRLAVLDEAQAIKNPGA